MVDGSSSEYGWDETLDGEGIVIWHHEDRTHDILYDFEKIKFTDKVVDISQYQTFDNIYDKTDEVQHLDGSDVTDRFVIDADSSDYQWDRTLDDQGIVVWNKCDHSHDILYDFEELVFNDSVIEISDLV